MLTTQVHTARAINSLRTIRRVRKENFKILRKHQNLEGTSINSKPEDLKDKISRIPIAIFSE